MAYVSLYRKWRPQTFEDVVGQEYVTRTLANALRNGNFAHAYLFAGPRGTGKTSTARILAKALNCEEGPTPTPCNRCASCRAITEGISVDVVEIDAASNRGIDDIRDLRERVIFTPASSRVKVYILDEAHMITKEAFNAFLKTLEEPPAHVVFVLATTEPHKMPQTILSRCQRHDFRSVPAPLMADYLRRVAEAEGFRVTDEALRLIARRARGSVRDALVTLEQLASYGDGDVDESDAAGFLGLIEDEMLVSMGDALISADAGRVVELVERAYEQGRDLVHFATQVQEHFRRILLLQYAQMGPAELEVDEASYQELKRQASALQPGRAFHFISSLRWAQEEMKHASAPRLVLESALIAMARESMEAAPEALAARLRKLEEEVERLARRLVRAGRETHPAASPGKGAETQPEARRRAVREEGARGTVEAAGGGDLGEALQSPPESVAELASPAVAVDLASVRRSWNQVRERVKEKKVTTHAFLLEGKPHEIKGRELIISFPPDRTFHRGEMEKEVHRRVLEEALEEVFGVRLRISTRLEDSENEGGDALAAGAPAAARRKAPHSEGGTAGSDRLEAASEEQKGAEQAEAPLAGGEEAAPSPAGERSGSSEASKVELVKDVFGAEMVEEIKLQE